MPTLTEILDSTLDAAVSACTIKCRSCKDGRSPDYSSDPEEFWMDDGRFCFAYNVTDCSVCKGSGVISPSVSDTGVLFGPISTAVAMAARLRDAGNFDGMNECIDWGVSTYKRWALMAMDADGRNLSDIMRDFGNRVQNGRDLRSDPNDENPKHGALTQDEIDALLNEEGAG